MDPYLQVIPKDITKLSNYAVPNDQFISTCVVLILLLLISLILMIKWIYRTYMGFTNTDYIADFAIKYETNKTMKNLATVQQQRQDEEFIINCRKYSRQQSRFLQIFCVIVIVAINIGTYTCNYMMLAVFGATVLIFILFNVIRLFENKFLRTIWVFVCVAVYLPFFIFHKSLYIT